VGVQAVTNGLSCGHILEVSGGHGAGTGGAVFSSVLIGPFYVKLFFLHLAFYLIFSIKFSLRLIFQVSYAI